MKNTAALSCLALLLFMSSCVSYSELSIEVFKPSEFQMPPTAKKITLLSRNLKYKTDTLQHYFQRNRALVKDKIELNFDSLTITTCLDSLAKKIQADPRFEVVKTLPTATFKPERIDNVRPASKEWYKSICDKTNADALIVLDMFSCFYSYDNASANDEAKVVTSNIWSIFDAKNQKIIDRKTQIDTLYWSQTDEQGNYKKLNIPDKKNAIILAAGTIGKNYSKHIMPGWTKVERSFMMVDNQEMKNAVKLAKQGNWTEAETIWQSLATGNNKQMKIAALYNLALASEMNGEIQKAIELTDQAAKESSGAFRSAVNEQVRKYSAVLYQRKNEINKLDQLYEAH